jgi:hypothetical protein
MVAYGETCVMIPWVWETRQPTLMPQLHKAETGQALELQKETFTEKICFGGKQVRKLILCSVTLLNFQPKEVFTWLMAHGSL